MGSREAARRRVTIVLAACLAMAAFALPAPAGAPCPGRHRPFNDCSGLAAPKWAFSKIFRTVSG